MLRRVRSLPTMLHCLTIAVCVASSSLILAGAEMTNYEKDGTKVQFTGFLDEGKGLHACFSITGKDRPEFAYLRKGDRTMLRNGLLSLEITGIDPGRATVSLRADKTNEVELSIRPSEALPIGGDWTPKPGEAFVRLIGSPMEQVIEIRSRLTGRIALRPGRPLLAPLDVDLKIPVATKASIRGLDDALLKHEIAAVDDGDKFALFIPTRDRDRILANLPPKPPNQVGPNAPRAAIDFAQIDARQAMFIYAELASVKVDRTRVPDFQITLNAFGAGPIGGQSLSKGEMIYAIQGSILANGYKVVEVRPGEIEIQPLPAAK